MDGNNKPCDSHEQQGDKAHLADGPDSVAAKVLSSSVLANVYTRFWENKHFFIAYQSTS